MFIVYVYLEEKTMLEKANSVIQQEKRVRREMGEIFRMDINI